ncbi:TetR/AcrR family transcriptional regulator C-terminal domain-containing protein [Nocardia sp. NPDC051052]|uniref:TetR/AcrR family transcriptional regulator C-terminal domain-containing protein n=1 Tax=Nocardia sp. NPDC051052 TaxID=3364322 RepID=UPI00378F1AAC
MKLDTQVIAQAALDLLDDVGLAGLTMRKVAAALDVQAPALYWHVKNKRELLDAMARTVFVAAVEGVEAPRQGQTWQEWTIGLATRLRRSMLRYRDGASVLAGTYVNDEAMWRTVELTLRTLEDAGFEPVEAGRVFPILLHYTVGFVIEEQARGGTEYDSNPYRRDHIEKVIDTARYPLTATLVDTLFTADFDAEFVHGLRVILAGVVATRAGQAI